MHRLVILFVVVACKNAEPTETPAPAPSVATNASPAPPAPPPTTPPTPAQAQDPPPVADTSIWIEADPTRPLAATLAEQSANAIRAGRKPTAYLHAAWCGPCRAIERTRHADPRMQAAFAGTFIVAIDVDKVGEKQIQAAGMRSSRLPIFYRLDATGRPTGDQIDGAAWRSDTPEHMAPALATFFAR